MGAHKSLFVYQGEEPREMTNSEYKKYVEHRKNCKEVFDALKNSGFFDGAICSEKAFLFEDWTKVSYLDILVERAKEVQWEIGQRSDYIRRDMVKEVQKITSKQISKKLFLDLVNWMRDQKAGDSKDFETIETKLDKEYTTHLYRQSLKNILYKNFAKHGTIKVPKLEEVEIQKIPNISLVDDPKFAKIIKKCADLRYEMDYELYPQYKKLAMAAEHLSHGDLTYERFKTIVNYNYYGWTESSEDPWEAQFNKYTHTQLIMDFMGPYKLCEKYGYGELFKEVKDHIINEYLKEQKTKKEKYKLEMLDLNFKEPEETEESFEEKEASIF